MANWETLRSYILSNYKVAEDNTEAGLIKLIFDTGEGRSQMVLVTNSGHFMGSDWARIAAPIGETSTIKVSDTQLLEKTTDLRCGFIAKMADIYLFCHSLPLADLDINEFEAPLQVVVNYGDTLEKELTGLDKF